jgi:polysaccharide biosynthesis protein PslG
VEICVRPQSIGRTLGCLLLLVLLSLAAPKAQSQPIGPHYFAESGHTLAEPFLSYWQATPDALRILGYPISEPFVEESFTEPGQFFRVQYFERAILEERPAERLQPGSRPSIAGRLLGTARVAGREGEEAFRPVAAPATPDGGVWDDVTGHMIADQPAPFKTFYERHGGLPIFGRPLSEQLQERNADTGAVHWVQYFERQRLEWHPEEDTSFQVQLGRLGEEYRAAHPGKAPPDAFAWRTAALPRREEFAYGVNATLYYTDRSRAAQTAASAGFGWIRQQVLWRAHEKADRTIAWDELDRIVEAVHGAGLKLLLCVVQAPDWATGMPGVTGLPNAEHRDDYAAFLGAITRRYGDKVAAFEIWNEMNLASENGGRPVPPTADYLDLLIKSYDAIKAANPNTIVVSGGAGPTEWQKGRDVAISDVLFVRELYADPRFWTHTDVIGVHVFGYANPPDSLWPAEPGPGKGWVNSREFYFRRVEDIRAEMVRAGHGHRQMWMTEFGWATTNDSPWHAFGNENSFEQQARYLERSFEIGRYAYQPWLGAMFVWNLNFAVTWQAVGNPLHEQAAYGILNPDWSPRPAFDVLARMPKP